MSKEKHVPFVAEYDEPNWKQVYTEARHNAALIKQNNSRERTVNKYYALTASAFLAIGFASYLSGFADESKAEVEKLSASYLGQARDSAAFGEISQLSRSEISPKAEVRHLTLESLDQLMSKVVSGGLVSINRDPAFVQTSAENISERLEPGKIVYSVSNETSEAGLFTAIVALTPSELYAWSGVVRDGKLTQLYTETDADADEKEPGLLKDEIPSSDALTLLTHQGSFLSGLDDGSSFDQSIEVLEGLVVSSRATKDIVSADVVTEGVRYLIKGLNESGSIPEGINSRNVNVNDLKKEGLIDMNTMKSYGQLKIIDVNPGSKLILGVGEKNKKASVFGGFATKHNGTWSFSALDLTDVIRKSKTFIVEGYDVIKPEDRYFDFSLIWDKTNNSVIDKINENTNN